MEVKKFDDLNLYLKGFEIQSIGNKAIREVQLENKERGIPLVYSVDGKIYYELADGTITTNSPFLDNHLEKETLIIKIKKMAKEKVNVEIESNGIKCDNPKCGWQDNTVLWTDADAVIAEWLNKPCPQCGANLLTEADAALIKTLYDIISQVNEMDESKLKEFAKIAEGEDFGEVVRATIEMNGTGNVEFNIKDIDDDK
ncbi:MAG: hypothetical protein WC979_02780 [Candidatus Pacearchaeota archaeon]|jgi:hypothetical protein|nr:hypothetical protein [Clostridia bacterium]